MTCPPLLLRAALVGLLACATLSCSSSSDDAADTTTTSPSPSSESSTSSPSTSPVSSGTSTTPSDATTTPAGSSVTVAVYWTRPYGQEQPIDLPGYRDDPAGPFPFVLFGSATNTGTSPIMQPRVKATWSSSGEVVYDQVAAVLDPGGGVLNEFAPGSSADVFVVVDDATVANRLPDLVPTFEAYDG